jgi:hypothetical protein
MGDSVRVPPEFICAPDCDIAFKFGSKAVGSPEVSRKLTDLPREDGPCRPGGR